MAYLIYCTGEEKEAFELEAQAELSIGRTSDNDIIILNDSSISRKHCLLRMSKTDGTFLEDLGSSNGTTVNEISLGRDAVSLKGGEMLKIGDAEFVFCVGNPEEFADTRLRPLVLHLKHSPPPLQPANTKISEDVFIDTVKIDKKLMHLEQKQAPIISPDSITISSGTEIEGYRIIREIGKGLFSETFLAYQKSVDRTVALKLFPIKQDYDVNVAFTTFKVELLNIANLDNPNLIHYFDCGVYTKHVFLSMPYVSEGNVKDMIKRSGKLPLEKSLFIISTLAEILNSMLKVSAPPHLSINPSNIIFNDSSSVILAGYGLKEWKFKYCLKNDTIEDWARYDGPEIKNNEKGDHRSDIYALGVLLCEMLSGQLNKGMIFIPDTALLSCKAIPANVIEIIRSATHQSRELRIQSYDELIERIKNTKKAVPKTKPPTPAIRKNNLKLNHLSRKIIIKKNN